MTTRTFRSSISLWLLIPLILLTMTVLIINIAIRIWPVAAFIVLMQFFILHLYLTTTYTITPDGQLFIRCGFFYRTHIDIQTIKRITPSNDPNSAPALSLNRIAIWHTGGHERVLVSPRERAEFIHALLAVNPGIIKEEGC